MLLAFRHVEGGGRKLERALVAGRDHGEGGGGLLDERLDELALRPAPQRDVEEKERGARRGQTRPAARHFGRDRERPRAIGELRGLQLRLVGGEQSSERGVGDLLGAREAKLAERACERSREAGPLANRSEAAERIAVIVDDACAQRLEREGARGDEPKPGELRPCE